MKKLTSLKEFLDYVHGLSVKDILIQMGYIKEDDFEGTKILCCFHKKDSAPSLQITDKFFKCYGCGKKGDLIKWIQLYDSLNFMEAVNKLAEFLDIEVQGEFKDYFEKQRKLRVEWEKYREDFNNNFKDNKDLQIQAKRFFPIECGYDKSMNYIVLPFTSKSGQILGFTKRRCVETDEPKWKHSYMEDSLLSSCHNFFGLEAANKDMVETKHVYLCEGPGDVAAIRRAKFNNTIGTSGTQNFSKESAKILEPFESLTFCYDNDNAGLKALKTSILTLAEISTRRLSKSYTIVYPNAEVKDPGSMTTEEIKEAIENKKNLLDWVVENCDLEYCQKLYHIMTLSNIKKIFVSKFANANGYTIHESEENLKGEIITKKEEKESEDDYKNQLLAVVGLYDNPNIKPLKISEEKAKKILAMRYKIVV